MAQPNTHVPTATAIEPIASDSRVRIDVPGVIDDCCEPFASVHYYANVTEEPAAAGNCSNADCVNGEVEVPQDGTYDGVWFAPSPCPDCNREEFERLHAETPRHLNSEGPIGL